MVLSAMAALNGTIHYAFESCRANSMFLQNSKGNSSRTLGYLNGSSLLDTRLQAFSRTITTPSALCKSYPIISALRRASRAPKRRNALRPKIIKLEKVRESGSEPHDSIIINEISLPEHPNEVLATTSGECLEENSEEGSVQNAYTAQGNEIETVGSQFWDTLDKWSSQYEEDVGFWGMGTAPVFIVYENAKGEVQSVFVDEDEILRRSGIRPNFVQFADEDTMSGAYKKIARAKLLAREIETGVHMPPRNSTLYRFLKPGKNRLQRWGDGLGSIAGQVNVGLRRLPFIVKFSICALTVFHVCRFVWKAQKYLFRDVPSEGKGMDEEKKKMLMRKMKSRMEKERMEANFVDKDIRVSDLKLHQEQSSMDGDELRKEGRDPVNVHEGMPAMDETELRKRVLATVPSKGKLPMDEAEFDKKILKIRAMAREARKIEQQESSYLSEAGKDADEVDNIASDAGELNGATFIAHEGSKGRAKELCTMDTSSSTGTLEGSLVLSRKGPRRLKPRVITSVQEARTILASKRGEPANNGSDDRKKHSALNGSDGSFGGRDGHYEQHKITEPSSPHEQDVFLPESSGANVGSAEKQTETSANRTVAQENYEKLRPSFQKAKFDLQKKVSDTKADRKDMFNPTATTFLESAKDRTNTDKHEDEIDGGKQVETASILGEENTVVSQEEAEEFDWMRDDALRDIVFKVKANEDSGRESFYGLGSEEERLFYRGIERKFEQEQERMNKWVNERIDNLDYGKDGIGFDDPPEACMAQWKDSTKARRFHILEKLKEDRQKFMREKMEQYCPPASEVESSSVMTKSIPKSASSVIGSSNSALSTNDPKGTFSKDSSANTMTVTSSSGKSSKIVNHSQSGSWQHTKKWSHALQEKYDAERDPEAKAILRDLGQDLDRWITEEEVKETAHFLSKGTKEQLEYFERVKARMQKESEMFGREAMINKYSEYKSGMEDHLWWVDLPYVLCIELYRNKDGEVMQGLYSLEMAPDLGSDGKRYHVVAFQDRGDATNFCYILQSDLSELGNGSAYVIPRRPKELYREAKCEGFKVTVIKKAQIKLYIDQTRQEVESIITGIGSAMYYDKILHDREIDIHSVLNGFGCGSP